MEDFSTEVFRAVRAVGQFNSRYPCVGHGEFGIYARRDGKLDKNLCRAAACRHLRESAEEFVVSLVADGVYDPRFARIALVYHDHLRKLCGLTAIEAANSPAPPRATRKALGQ